MLWFANVSDVPGLEALPEWMPCTDCDYLRLLPTMRERRKWLRKAKAEITRRRIQERLDEIAEAYDGEDALMVTVLVEAFPKDLERCKSLTPAQRRMWISRAEEAACGRNDNN
ncbi:hypothetical protein [Rhodopseudomonas palustris]|nr:hypothetical protein [Rhodopseudomonas palustris]